MIGNSTNVSFLGSATGDFAAAITGQFSDDPSDAEFAKILGDTSQEIAGGVLDAINDLKDAANKEGENKGLNKPSGKQSKPEDNNMMLYALGVVALYLLLKK